MCYSSVMTLSMSALNAWCGEYLLLKRAARPALFIALSYCCSATTAVYAEPIFYGDSLTVASNAESMLADEKSFTAPLLTMSPVPPDAAGSVPEFSDPLGLGFTTYLNPFDRNVHFMDMLAKPYIPAQAGILDIELLTGTLRDIDMLDDIDAFYYSYDGRAFDNAILDLQAAEIVEFNGVPRTREGAPLSIMGFGKVVPEP